MYTTFVAADLDTKARCKLACGRVLVGKYAPAASATFVLSHGAVFFTFFSNRFWPFLSRFRELASF